MRPKGMDLTVIPPLFPRHIFDCVKLAISSSPEAYKILKKKSLNHSYRSTLP